MKVIHACALGLPDYRGGGEILPRLYDAGGLTLDSLTEGAASERMLTVCGASEADMAGYEALLCDAGYRSVYRERLGGQCCACYGKAGAFVHLSYYPCGGRLLITRELNALSVRELSYGEKDGGGFEFYMYGLNMDPGGYNPTMPEWAEYNTSGFVNCGMLFAARTADGALLLIDGGKASQHPGGSLATLNRFLHRIARKGEGERIRISAWFITHAHEDHYEGVAALLAKYPEQYSLERVLANFPAPKPEVFAERFAGTVRAVREHYPDCVDFKLHTGDSIRLSSLTLRVLYTHENTLGEDGTSLVRDYNDTTTVVALEGDGRRVMLLGDISELAEERILDCCGANELRSDVVQVAHHNFNHLVRIYEPIGAPIACFAQTLEGTRKNESTRANAKPVLDTAKTVYYSGDITKTVGFSVTSDGVREIFRYNDFTDR